MRVEVKKWGNGLAIRLPREAPGYGRLEPGMTLEVEIRPLKAPAKGWKPYTFRSGMPNLSERIDELAWGFHGEATK